MRVTETNWMQLDEFVRHDDRAILPLGSVEQHGYLSLGTDMILAERVAVEAAEPLGIPVFPALPYGITPYFRAFPGSLGLRVSTYVALVRDLLECMLGQGFRRVVLVNGHGGNSPVAGLAAEFTADHPEARIVVHNWWNAPQTWQAVMAVDADASHASWMEGFPWTRVAQSPDGKKAPLDHEAIRRLPPVALRELLGDGNYGGFYERPVDTMLHIWEIAVGETREVIRGL